MKDKIYVYVLYVLIFLVLAMGVQIFFLKREINNLLDEQVSESRMIKEKNLNELVGIDSLKINKEALIIKKEQSLYKNVEIAEENYINYEEIKKNISNNDDADSLARQFAKRYSQ